MAIKQLRTYKEIAHKVWADRAYRTVRDVEKELDSISSAVSDSLALLNEFRISTLKANNLVIDVERPAPVSNPKIKKFGTKHIKELDKNFRVIHSLYDAKTNLENLEAKLRLSNRDMGADVSKAMSGIAQIRKQIYSGLTEAFAFLSEMGTKNAPEFFAEFSTKLSTLCSRSIKYEELTVYPYMFAQEDSLCFAYYLKLSDVIDDNGARLPELYVVTSAVVGNKSEQTEYYLDVLHEFTPPSSDLFTTKIDPSKMQSVLMDLSDLLSVSHFANSIKRIPVKLLLNPGAITPDIFGYEDSISEISFDDENHQINFWLKPTVTEKSTVDRILTQLHLDLKGLMIATRARLSQAVTTKKNPKGNSCFVISFFLVKNSNAPSANVDDIEFLKTRFDLSDATVNKILQTINRE